MIWLYFGFQNFLKKEKNQNSSCCDKLYFPISLENCMKRMMKQVGKLFLQTQRLGWLVLVNSIGSGINETTCPRVNLQCCFPEGQTKRAKALPQSQNTFQQGSGEVRGYSCWPWPAHTPVPSECICCCPCCYHSSVTSKPRFLSLPT